MLNLVAIPQGVSFPRMREIAHQNVYSASFFGFFQRATAQTPEPIFTRNTSNDAFPQGCAFSGVEDKNLTFTPRNSRKPAILGPDFDGTYRSKTALQWGCFHVNSP